MISGHKSNVINLRGKSEESRRQALERLFYEHSGPLRAFLWARLGITQELDDIVQEVFAKLAKLEGLRERLPKGNDSNRAFIFTIANNLALNIEKHKQVRRRYVDQKLTQAEEQEPPLNPAPETIVIARQELERVKKAIMQMRPNWQKAFVLNRFKHKSYKQIAIEMQVSVKQVEKYMKHALIQVRRASCEPQGIKS